ncbi:hypothetical protein M5C99_09075 [Acidovorax sp. NCPPB 2350]|nr:hypothetical protein M5C99_09075 [Acidovorax sp. NCPPB 2350]
MRTLLTASDAIHARSPRWLRAPAKVRRKSKTPLANDDGEDGSSEQTEYGNASENGALKAGERVLPSSASGRFINLIQRIAPIISTSTFFS